MPQKEKLKYRIAVKYESDHFVEAESAEEAVALWQKELKLDHLPYRFKDKEWIKGGFRLIIEFQEHLCQTNRDVLGESISINDKNKAGESVL